MITTNLVIGDGHGAIDAKYGEKEKTGCKTRIVIKILLQRALTERLEAGRNSGALCEFVVDILLQTVQNRSTLVWRLQRLSSGVFLPAGYLPVS